MTARYNEHMSAQIAWHKVNEVKGQAEEVNDQGKAEFSWVCPSRENFEPWSIVVDVTDP